MSLNIPQPSRHKNSAAAEQEKRCECGHLLAILLENGIELKCKRCKRLHTIQTKDLIKLFYPVRYDSLSNWVKDREPLSSDPSPALTRNSSPCQCYIRKETEK